MRSSRGGFDPQQRGATRCHCRNVTIAIAIASCLIYISMSVILTLHHVLCGLNWTQACTGRGRRESPSPTRPRPPSRLSAAPAAAPHCRPEVGARCQLLAHARCHSRDGLECGVFGRRQVRSAVHQRGAGRREVRAPGEALRGAHLDANVGISRSYYLEMCAPRAHAIDFSTAVPGSWVV